MAVRVRHDLHRLAGRRVRGGTLRGGLGLLSWGLLARSRRRLLLVVIRVGTVLLSVLRRLLVTFVTRVASRHGDRRRHHVVTVRVRHHATKVRRVGGLLLDGGAAVDRVGQLGHHTGVARLLLTRFRLRLLRLLLLLTLLLRLLTLLLSLLHAPTSRTGGGIKTKAEVAAGGGEVSKLKSEILRLRSFGRRRRLSWARRRRRSIKTESKAIGSALRLLRRFLLLLRSGRLALLRWSRRLLRRHRCRRSRTRHFLGPVHRRARTGRSRRRGRRRALLRRRLPTLRTRRRAALRRRRRRRRRRHRRRGGLATH